ESRKRSSYLRAAHPAERCGIGIAEQFPIPEQMQSPEASPAAGKDAIFQITESINLLCHIIKELSLHL
uniref:hypothetical protein n=1 Tax=Eubacterium cellulosolvens TaxID=29322 RepID=UPI001A98E612